MDRPAGDLANIRLEKTYDGKTDPSEANYREADNPDERCRNCMNFDGRFGCSQVAGKVDAAGVCDLFEGPPSQEAQ